MNKTSSGILLYRLKNNDLQIFLVHPGGPHFKNKDLGWWSIPKGLVDKDEDLLETALRELMEETHIVLDKSDKFIELGSIQQKSGKIVHAWAYEYNEEITINTETNTTTIEWPYKSGRMLTIPENDKGEWYDIETAKEKINQAQKEFIVKLGNTLNIEGQGLGQVQDKGKEQELSLFDT